MMTAAHSVQLFLYVFLLSLLDAAADGISEPIEDFVINSATEERTSRALPMGPPTRVVRAKISMVGTKMVMGVRWSATQVFDIYQFRVRWAEPVDWNDNDNDSDRRYELECWVEDLGNGDRKTLFKRQVGAWFSGYHEKYRFPPGMDLATQCQVRAINTAGFTTAWKPSNRINVKDIPVYFPGINGVDLRGLSQEDVLAVLTKISTEDAAAAPPLRQLPKLI
uniref:Uncharacterized protein n=1 Tax=Plectus sambesii TaxID=2011161 RepID=A0A914V4R0_9BILA